MIFTNTSMEQGKTFIHVSTHPSSVPQEYGKSDMNQPYSERTNLASELAHHLVNMHKITPISTTPQKSKAYTMLEFQKVSMMNIPIVAG